jgi:hypothetical protein
MQIDEYFSSNLTYLEYTVKNLKVSVISVCFSFIFLLISCSGECYAYHDLGPSHLDSNAVALFHASHNKTKSAPFIPETQFTLILPETPSYVDSLPYEYIPYPETAFLTQLSSRASPMEIQ